MGLIFIVLAIIPICYDYVVCIKVTDDIWNGNSVTMKSDGAETRAVRHSDGL